MIITDKNELKKFGPTKRIWQGIPSVEATASGRLFCSFYSGGTKEEYGNFCLIIKSDDDGATWEDPIVVAYNGEDSRCYDCCIWIDPLGRLWFTWGEAPNHALWASICENPDADTLEWTEPFMVGKEVMMNKPTVLSTGEWLFPIAVWADHMVVVSKSDETDRRPFIYKTTDNGKTFTRLGGPIGENRSFDEHSVLELSDGTLLMLTRGHYDILKSYSYDRGLTWSELENSGFKSPSARFSVQKLDDGYFLLINHYNFEGRNNLTAMISRDDCKTWEGFLLLDERTPVTYPNTVVAKNGYIYVVYDYGRGAFLKSMKEVMENPREILMAKFTLEDVMAGKIVSSGSKLKTVISKLSVYDGENKDPFDELNK